MPATSFFSGRFDRNIPTLGYFLGEKLQRSQFFMEYKDGKLHIWLKFLRLWHTARQH